jgi:hypothetical protein
MLIDSGSCRRTTITMVQVTGDRMETVSEAIRASWPGQPGLRAASLHRALTGNRVVEYAQWDTADRAGDAADSLGRFASIVPEFELRVYRADDGLMTPGPGREATFDGLVVDPVAKRPTLIAVLQTDPDRHDELVAYLTESAKRFRGLFGGWIGAVLHPRPDRRGVVEYLQFDSLAAMGATQGLAEIHQHKERLDRFGMTDIAPYDLADLYDPAASSGS